jgi:glyceraldehyde-3-phosphate dehydrogenase (NADP+)
MSSAAKIQAIFADVDKPTDSARIDLPIEQREYLVDGELRTWSGPLEAVHACVCRAEGGGPKPILMGGYPSLSTKEALAALDAAVRAYGAGRGAWPTMAVAQRIRHLEQFAFRMKEQREQVVRLLCWEIGKTRADAEKEFDRTVDYIGATIDAVKELDRVGSRFSIEEGIVAQIRRAPLGVVLCMGPYNYPLNETFTTLIPALIMGNTVVFKPAKHGVLLLRPLLAAFRDAFPAGVVNTVYGEGSAVIGPLMESGKIDCLAFIGSAKVADVLKHQHPKPHRLRSVLGLGAKNAAIVLADADLDNAAAECVLGALSYNGQRCTALKIIFVQRRIADAFLAKLVPAVEALPFGLPWQEKVKITPLCVPGKPDYLRRAVDEAVAKGARVLNEGGGTVHGTYFHPAVVYPVSPRTELYEHEQFGPVVPVVPFDDISEPIRYVEQSPYGQQVSLFGKSPTELASLIDPLVNQVCRVNVNSQCQRGPDSFPFTGRKDSAEGTLSVSDALRVFSIRTLVAAKGSEGNKAILSQIVHEQKSSFLSTDFIL